MTAPFTLKPSALVAAAHVIASDGPGEVVRKLDAAFDAAVATHGDLDADMALTIDQRDTAEGWADGLAALIGKYFGRDVGEHSSAHCPWQEAKEIIAEAEPYQPAAPALKAPAAPAPVQIQALHRARRALYAISKTYDDSELRTRALEADEEIDRMLTAAPEAPAAPSALATQVIENLLKLARIVNTAVEDWGETQEDDSMEVIFHKEEADKMESILEFFDSLPDAPAEEGVIESGPLRAARVLRALAAPAAPEDVGVVFDMVALVKQLVREHRVAEPHSLVARAAMKYLQRHGLLDSPLRLHTDDAALDRFTLAMRAKLAAAREKGRGGWETCPPEVLNRMLHEHLEKGDPRDVANFCMFLWHTGHRTTMPAPAVVGSDAALPTWWAGFIQCVAELPDRNSPEDEPEAMLATAEELGACALAAQAKEGGAA